MTLAENFWESLTPDGDCLIWTHAKDGGGYGKVSVGARLVKAHRYAYELAKGPIPEGLDIDHLCRVRACCNPDHLEAVTRQVNVLRGAGPSAQQARWTHCPQGHEFTEANTLRTEPGKRRCRECHNARQRAYNARKKAAA